MKEIINYALVTGASSGIGQATSIKLAENGYNILINYKTNREGALITKQLVEATGMKAELLPFDVSKSTEVKKQLGNWITQNDDKFIEVLINNAGMRKDNLLIFTTEEEWHEVMNVNLNSFFYVTKQVINKMIIKRRGSVISISSVSGVKGWKGQTHYSAAKAGVIAASKSLAREVGKKNIRVNVVTPGFISTKMISNVDEEIFKSTVALDRFGSTYEIGDVIAFLVSEKSSFINGQVISVDGGDGHPFSE